MLKWKIKAQANPKAAAEIYIYGDIGESWWEETTSARDFISQLETIKNEDITVRINSVGGSVPDGIAIFNALKRHSATVTIAIDGMAYSIASLISMAGDVVEMADNALLMIHGPWVSAVGNSKEFREYADMLDQWSDAMANSYAAKSGKDHAEILQLLTDGDDHYYTAAEAQNHGFVDQISESLPIAASRRVPEKAMDRYSSAPVATRPFLIKARKAAKQTGDPVMDRIEQIQAAFNAHLPKDGVQALMKACIDDESTTAEQAQAKLDELLTKPSGSSDSSEGDAVARGVVLEASRRDAVQAVFTPFADRAGASEVLQACLSDTNVTEDIARTRLLAHLGKDGESVAGGYAVDMDRASISAGGNQQFLVDASAAILARSGLASAEDRAKARKNPLRGASLLDFAKASLDRAGFNYSMMDNMAIVGAAFTQSTSDFPILLEDAMHKAMQAGYRIQAFTWNRFCRTGSVSDFRAHGRYRTGSIGSFNVVNELGEFESKPIPDGEKSTIQADTVGAIVNLSRKAIVNDDLGAFLNISRDLGQAAGRTIELSVYALLAENSGLGPTMSDGHPLFDDANHKNVGSGAAISMVSIESDRVLLASQTDVSGNDFLDLRPSVLLLPIGLGGSARSINDAQYDPDTANKLQKPNIVNGLYSDIVDTPRLSGTRRYSFADPNEAPVIEVAFLNGETEPVLEMMDGFTVDGTRYKARLDFGTAAIDHRGAVTNGGA